jgi:hypothetical protein
VVRQFSNFFSNPSVVSLITAMASATRAQVVAKEGEMVLKAKNKAAAMEVAKAASAPAQIGKSPSLALHYGSLEGYKSLITVFEIPHEGLSELGSKVVDVVVVAEHVACTKVPPSHKCGCLSSDGACRCHCRANDANEAIGKVRVIRSPQISVALGASNVEDSLPTPEILLHIAIEVVGRLRLAQETRSLFDEELSLVDFLLD